MSEVTLTHALYEGHVEHHRREPREHSFRYPIWFVYLDIDHLSQAFAGRWLWSDSRPSVAWFRREDHAGEPGSSLSETIRNLLKRAGYGGLGRICLLTQLRHFGFVMNPVSFYYCFSEQGDSLSAIVAEVHNTPWGERHCYVLPATPRTEEIWLDKEFHVSPFMPMEQRYRFRFSDPGEMLSVSIDSFQQDSLAFSARLRLRRRAWTTLNLLGLLCRLPFPTQRIYAAIYWQAFRLWWKGTPYFPHPGHSTSAADTL